MTLDSSSTLLNVRPELRLFENIVREVDNFIAPDESLRTEFSRALAHPSHVLNVIPEKLNERLDSGGIPE